MSQGSPKAKPASGRTRRRKTVRSNHPVTVRSPASKARERFSEILNRVAYRRDRVLLERHGRAVAAVVPVEDLELLEELEDRLDLEDARAALAEAKANGTRPWEKIKAALGL